MFVLLNDQIVPAAEAKISVNDHGFLYSDGVYETLRTYHSKIWQIDEHLTRLRQSATILSLQVPYSDKQISEWLDKLLAKNGFKESRVRITLTRGNNNFDFVTCSQPTFLIQVAPLMPEPREVYEEGVNIITVQFHRFLPEVKSISLLPFIIARQHMAKTNAYEAIFTDLKGFACEGTVTNIFIVKDNVLKTPGNNILFGTTRDLILEMAREINMKVEVTDLAIKELQDADEIFITNAPRGIVPVRRIDESSPKKAPGSITQTLMQTLQHKIEKLEDTTKH